MADARIRKVKAPKQPRTNKLGSVAKKPVSKIYNTGKKEFYLPLPDNRIGRFLNKRRSFIPRFLKDSWKELMQVTWPGRKETIQLTLAVFMFAFCFGLLIAVTDYGLDKLFRKVLL